jgi:hypothetical protein
MRSNGINSPSSSGQGYESYFTGDDDYDMRARSSPEESLGAAPHSFEWQQQLTGLAARGAAGAAPGPGEAGAAPGPGEAGAAPGPGEAGAAPGIIDPGAAPFRGFAGAAPRPGEAGAAPRPGEAGAAPRPGEAGAGFRPGFNIDISYSGDPAYLPLFQQAADTWSSIITQDVQDFDGVDDLSIDITVEPIDGPQGLLGGAEPLAFRPGSGLPYAGSMVIDSDDLDTPHGASTVLHEMGHLLGIGASSPAWDKLRSNNQYTGANALAQFQALSPANANASFIPLESSGGEGAEGVHWDDDALPGELMNAKTSPDGRAILSSVTVGALADLGYTVDYSQAQEYT